MPAINLKELLKDLPLIPKPDANKYEITGITTDPNLCKPGYLYVAAECETVDSTRYGVRLDGRDYIEQALANGALALLTTPETAARYENATTALAHKDPLAVLGELASRYFGEPKPEHVALVTGTNGKTSTVNFSRALWTRAGFSSCCIGNLGGVCSDGTLVWDRDPTLSVPETVTLHNILHDLAQRGINHVAMEATSHALFDWRLHGVRASVGAFTNLTRDHLDFHQTMEEYFRVKMLLFNEVLQPGSFAVLNADAAPEWYEPALEICRSRRHQIISYGFNGNEIKLLKSEQKADGQKLELEVYGKKYQADLNLFGMFQTSNALAALGIALASAIEPEQAVSYLSALTEVEGRLNTVAFTPNGGRAIVDYAHTPDGLRAALEAARSLTPGKLAVVFACNGERDQGKRREMGEIAAALADEVIITDGHPRSEDPATIRQDVMEGAPRAMNIADRPEAILTALKLLKEGDSVLIAGLGHENFRTIGSEHVPYSDSETAKRLALQMKESLKAKN